MASGIRVTGGRLEQAGLSRAKEIGYDYSSIQRLPMTGFPCIFIENGRGVNLDPNDPLYVSYKENFPGEPTGKDNP